MVCPSNSETRQSLETIYRNSPSISFYQRFIQFLQNLGLTLVHELTRDWNAPRISQYYSTEGKKMWYVYDPMTQTSFTTQSEAEVREWIDRHHLS
ncbi:MAG: hypothetical protein F6K42_25810 [Leptolyngbya sp. SIO1D8]|nr:hypothetical protein [Leptolyngbya sp. SIO1D8]